MVAIDPKDPKYIITFKRKDLRPNKRDDKLEIFRQAVGLEDVSDILDLSHFTGHHMTSPVRKTNVTVTDINSYETPFVIARLNLDQVNRLRKNPNVELVEDNQLRYMDEEIVGYQIPTMEAGPGVWNAPLNIRGAGVNVAVIDTGCDPHIDFGGNLKVNQNFGNLPGFAAADAVHHGTHVCGTVGAAAGNNEGIQGVAPSCNIWNIKTISSVVSGGQTLQVFQTADLVEALTYCNQNNAHIVNMSLSGPNSAAAEQTAITAGFSTGNIVYVAAAGNESVNVAARYPAGYTGVISISNLAETLTALHPTSSRGPYVDFTAPGHNIVSLAENNLYRSLTGTSMACPGFAGVCALMYSAFPGGGGGCPPTTPGAPRNQQIENVLRDTAKKTGLSGAGPVGQKDSLYGYGLPRAQTAVSTLKGVLPSALLR